MVNKISILGCGWLGLPLGRFLVEKGYTVKGSTTKEEKLDSLKSAGIEPYRISLEPDWTGDDAELFFSSDLLIINIPPSLRKQSEEFHIRQMEEVARRIASTSLKKVIYISSTSIYPDLNREVMEIDVAVPEKAENKTLFTVEEIWRSEKKLNTLIVRCAGLAGYDRNLVKHFAGKKELPMGNAPVNLIHRDDVIGILFELIKRDKWNDTFNISAPAHPLRKNLYPALANKYGFECPSYNLNDQASFKLINTEKLMREVKYQFKFPDPLTFYYEPLVTQR